MFSSLNIRILLSKVNCLLLITTFYLVHFASSAVLSDNHPWPQPGKSVRFSPVASLPPSPPPSPLQAPVPVSYRVQISLGDVSSESSSATSTENSHSAMESSMMLPCPNSTKQLSVEQVCDGVDHCPGGSDESKLACDRYKRERRNQFEAEQVNILFFLAAACVSGLFYLLFLSILLVHCYKVWRALKKQSSVKLSFIRTSK